MERNCLEATVDTKHHLVLAGEGGGGVREDQAKGSIRGRNEQAMNRE